MSEVSRLISSPFLAFPSLFVPLLLLLLVCRGRRFSAQLPHECAAMHEFLAHAVFCMRAGFVCVCVPSGSSFAVFLTFTLRQTAECSQDTVSCQLSSLLAS